MQRNKAKRKEEDFQKSILIDKQEVISNDYLQSSDSTMQNNFFAERLRRQMFGRRSCIDCDGEMQPLTLMQPIELACSHEICIKCSLKQRFEPQNFENDSEGQENEDVLHCQKCRSFKAIRNPYFASLITEMLENAAEHCPEINCRNHGERVVYFCDHHHEFVCISGLPQHFQHGHTLRSIRNQEMKRNLLNCIEQLDILKDKIINQINDMKDHLSIATPQFKLDILLQQYEKAFKILSMDEDFDLETLGGTIQFLRGKGDREIVKISQGPRVDSFNNVQESIQNSSLQPEEVIQQSSSQTVQVVQAIPETELIIRQQPPANPEPVVQQSPANPQPEERQPSTDPQEVQQQL